MLIYDLITFFTLHNQIIRKEVNFTIGYFNTNVIRNYYMTNTFSHYTSKICFIRPPGRPLTSFEKLFFPFSTVLWFFVLFIFSVAFTVIFTLKFQSKVIKSFTFGRKNQSPNLNLINIFFGGSTHNIPIRNFARTLFMLWVFYCFIIRTAYQGALFKILQNPINISSVNTIQDMIDQNYLFYMTSLGNSLYNGTKEVSDRFVILFFVNIISC